ncbi:hypothetical protein FRB98_003562, partial [Tulasnella sp. 332]
SGLPADLVSVIDEDRIMFPSLRALDLDQEVIHTYVLASSLLPSLTTLVARSFDDDDAMASH